MVQGDPETSLDSESLSGIVCPQDMGRSGNLQRIAASFEQILVEFHGGVCQSINQSTFILDRSV